MIVMFLFIYTYCKIKVFVIRYFFFHFWQVFDMAGSVSGSLNWNGSTRIQILKTAQKDFFLLNFCATLYWTVDKMTLKSSNWSTIGQDVVTTYLQPVKTGVYILKNTMVLGFHSESKVKTVIYFVHFDHLHPPATPLLWDYFFPRRISLRQAGGRLNRDYFFEFITQKDAFLKALSPFLK